MLVEPDLGEVDQHPLRRLLAAEHHSGRFERAAQPLRSFASAADLDAVMAELPLDVVARIATEHACRFVVQIATARHQRRRAPAPASMPSSRTASASSAAASSARDASSLCSRSVSTCWIDVPIMNEAYVSKPMRSRIACSAARASLQPLPRPIAAESLVGTVLREQHLLVRVLERLDVEPIDLGDAHGALGLEHRGARGVEASASGGEHVAARLLERRLAGERGLVADPLVRNALRVG